jgi:GNAT superfamily N-acetyltransferase
MLELIPIHSDLPTGTATDLKQQCIDLLNVEWPRSESLRLRTLDASKESFPMCLALVHKTEDSPKVNVIGHVKLSCVPSKPKSVWIESVVIHPDLRGQGIGKYLMLVTEKYCRDKQFITGYLCTIDKQVFYSRCGYKFCEPVTASSGTVRGWGGSSSVDAYMPPNTVGKNKKPPPEEKEAQRDDELGLLCTQVFQVPSLPEQEPVIKLPLRTLTSPSTSVRVADKSQIQNRITIHKDFMKKPL